MRKVSKKRAAHRASKEGKAGMEYMRKVKQLPCCICGAPPPSDAHHCISNRYGTSKVSDFEAIPLCKEHHQIGPDAIHNGKATWEERHGPDTNYINQTRNLVEKLL